MDKSQNHARLTSRDLERLFAEAEASDLHDYVAEPRRNGVKTFRYFCERLSQSQTSKAVSGSDLREYINGRLAAAGIPVTHKFNPEGWFAADWTTWINRSSENHFRPEFAELLARTGKDPYWYEIRPDYFTAVKSLLHPAPTPIAIDVAESNQADRIATTISRIMRDTGLSRRVKEAHNFECQICGESLTLPDQKRYAEAHHLKPLGAPHHGPDVQENIVCVCPNHHVLLDFAAISLDKNRLRTNDSHSIGDDYIAYHNARFLNIQTAD